MGHFFGRDVGVDQKKMDKISRQVMKDFSEVKACECEIIKLITKYTTDPNEVGVIAYMLGRHIGKGEIIDQVMQNAIVVDEEALIKSKETLDA